jgi:hypothetical protein
MTTSHRISGYLILIYWFLFWAMNGLDKFMHGVSVAGLFTWHGKDRTQQFTGYFERMGLDHDAIVPLLGSCGAIELAVALPFALALLGPRLYRGFVEWAFAASAAMFIGFSLWDVVAGDRAELLEHGTYIGVVFVTRAYLEFTKFSPVALTQTQKSPALAFPGRR